MRVEDIMIKQSGNRYELFHALGYRVMVVDMVPDNQFFLDAKALYTISKAINLRWKQEPSKENKLKSFGYSGMNVLQIGINEYAIYLPSGQQIAWIMVPPDENYIDDDKVFKVVCKCLALRYGINSR